MTDTALTSRGACLVCTPQGNVTNLIYDDLGLPDLAPGRSLLSLLDRDSLTKGLTFFRRLRTQGAAFDWELIVAMGGEPKPMNFAGGQWDDNVLVCIASTSDAARRVYEDMMSVNNEQANRLRVALKHEAAMQDTSNTPQRDAEVYEDMTRLNNELAMLQRELAKKNAVLEQLDQQKNAFLGMAAHDLRNPLGVIQTYSQFLIEEAAPVLNPEQREFLSIIRSTSGFVLNMVEELLDVATIESGRLQLDHRTVDLIALVRHGVTLNGALAAPKQISISVVLADGLPDVLWLNLDTGKIEQVLNNLLTNAVKYSPAGTQVQVRLHAGAGKIIVSVKDQGQGIAPAEMDKLFKMFSTTSARTTGGESSTGLGLAIARRIIEGHQGRIWAESTIGEGSTFSFELPWPDQAQNMRPNIAEPAQTAPAGQENKVLRVLVVDDSRMQQRVAQLVLGKLGHTVVCARSGEEALEMLVAEPYDVVLLDLQMPGLSGIETAWRIPLIHLPGGLPILLAVTGTVDESVAAECLSAGMQGTLSKPLKADNFAQLVSELDAKR